MNNITVIDSETKTPADQAAPVVAEPSRLIELAITQNADIGKLERLMDLQERWNNDQSKKAFYQAVAAFQSEMPLIHKSKTASFATKNGGHMNYNYASIDDIVKAVNPVLHRHGLSYRFEQTMIQGVVSVSCILTHALGHCESCTMTGGLDQSGNKNALQQIASSTTYLKKYTLTNVLGVATSDDDIDGFQPCEPSASQEQNTSQPALPDYYEQDDFNRMLPNWLKAIQSGKKTPDTLITFVESKGRKLTEEQKARIQGVK